jgi:protein arginine N-methyltransferase 1
MFLPWLEPVTIVEGQELNLKLCANLVGDQYVWRWETKIWAGGALTHHFQQSTLQGVYLNPATLRHRSAEFVPSLSEEGCADRWLLQAIDSKTSLQQMAQAAAHRFPVIFPKWEDALHRAAELAAQFSR